MDPTGFSVGVNGLAYLVSTCIEAFQSLCSILAFSSDTAILLTKLGIEKELFLQWAVKAGLLKKYPVKGRLFDVRTDALIYRVLQEIRKLLMEANSVPDQFQKRKHGFADLIRHRREKRRRLEDSDENDEREVKKVGLGRKFTWSVHRRDEMGHLIDELGYFIGKLDQMIPVKETRARPLLTESKQDKGRHQQKHSQNSKPWEAELDGQTHAGALTFTTNVSAVTFGRPAEQQGSLEKSSELDNSATTAKGTMHDETLNRKPLPTSHTESTDEWRAADSRQFRPYGDEVHINEPGIDSTTQPTLTPDVALSSFNIVQRPEHGEIQRPRQESEGRVYSHMGSYHSLSRDSPGRARSSPPRRRTSTSIDRYVDSTSRAKHMGNLLSSSAKHEVPALSHEQSVSLELTRRGSSRGSFEDETETAGDRTFVHEPTELIKTQNKFKDHIAEQDGGSKFPSSCPELTEGMSLEQRSSIDSPKDTVCEHLQTLIVPSSEDGRSLAAREQYDDEPVKSFDVRSIVSNDYDVASQASLERPAHVMWAEDYLANILVNDEDIRELCKEALYEMGRDRVRRNLRRLLKLYYLTLARRANNDIERSAVALLRRRISREIVASKMINGLNASTQEERRLLDYEILAARSRIQAWLDGTSSEDVPNERNAVDVAATLENPSEADSEVNSDPDPESNQLPVRPISLGQLESFIKSDDSFRLFRVKLQAFLLPASLASITRILLTIPTERIFFMEVYEQSLSDRIKSRLESVSGAKWDWWPLSKSQPLLQLGHVRIKYLCVGSCTYFRS